MRPARAHSTARHATVKPALPLAARTAAFQRPNAKLTIRPRVCVRCVWVWVHVNPRTRHCSYGRRAGGTYTHAVRRLHYQPRIGFWIVSTRTMGHALVTPVLSMLFIREHERRQPPAPSQTSAVGTAEDKWSHADAGGGLSD